MLNRLGIFVDFEGVLGKFPRETWQVGRRPCEDIPVLMEKLDELTFLFLVEAGTNDGLLFWVVFCELDFLGVILCRVLDHGHRE